MFSVYFYELASCRNRTPNPALFTKRPAKPLLRAVAGRRAILWGPRGPREGSVSWITDPSPRTACTPHSIVPPPWAARWVSWIIDYRPHPPPAFPSTGSAGVAVSRITDLLVPCRRQSVGRRTFPSTASGHLQASKQSLAPGATPMILSKVLVGHTCYKAICYYGSAPT